MAAAAGASHPEGRPHLINHVDRLVGEKTLVDMAVGQLGGRLEGRGRVFDPVVLLVAGLETLENGHRIRHRGLDHIDLLKTAGEGAVLLEMVFILLVGGGPDTAQVAGLQGGLEEVGGVHAAAAGGPGSDDGVDLVDKENNLGPFLHRADHRLEPLLEIAPILGAGEQAPHIQQADLHSLQHLRNPATLGARGGGLQLLLDQQSQPFGDGGLAHPGLTHQQGVVLAAAAEGLHHPFKFRFPANQGVDLAPGRQGAEVDGEFLQGLGLLIGGPTLGFAAAGGLGRVARRRLRAILRPSVGDILHHLQLLDSLQAEEIDRK